MRTAIALAAVLLSCSADAALAGRLTPGLERMTSDLRGSDDVDVLVVLRDQAPVASLDAALHAARATRAERHRVVIDALHDAADRSQGPLLAVLAAQRDAGVVRSFSSCWLVNAIGVTATVDAVRALAARPDVDVIEPGLAVAPLDPVTAERGHAGGSLRSIGITAGLIAIQARRVWTELGIDGTGSLVGNLDTGVDGTHPALAARWRGNFAPASECWRDAVGFGDATPVDRNAHGTHVMGTICGLAEDDTIGVAPGALWIADNAINQSVGPEFNFDILVSLQWFSDPDGDSSTLDDVPDVVQNSWGVNEALGYPDCDSRWWLMIDHAEAAGVVLSWSAGGDGPAAATVRSPADRATTPYNTFAVGATSPNPPYAIAYFSSRGPSGCGGVFAVKPEIVAPGVDTYSSVPGGGYETWSGSAMAGPHVAGVVALLREADPDLEVDTIKQILMDTCVDLGPAGEDNAYGHGFLDAYAAVVAGLEGYGRIAGGVTNRVTGDPVADVEVAVEDTPRALTEAGGHFDVPCAPGSWTLSYSAVGYVTGTRTVPVAAHDIADGSISLVPVGSAAPLDASPPHAFELGFPHPSPTASGMSVEYAVPASAADVWISVHDVAGRHVRTLVRGHVAAGRHIAAWDGRDAAGRRAAGGVYLCRLRAGTFSQTRKVTLLD